jgi:hypothetical protein
VESFPIWLKHFCSINPETYSVHALKAIIFKDAGLQAIKGDIFFLVLFALSSIILEPTFFDYLFTFFEIQEVFFD